MKKVYFLILSAFFAGGLMAQSTFGTSASTKVTKVTKANSKENVTNVGTDSKNATDANTNVNVDKKPKVKSNVPTVSNSNKTVVVENKREARTSNVGLSSLPGYPKYVNTGNKELDDANYRQAKELWIQNNQDLYNKYKGNGSGKTRSSNSTNSTK